MQKWSFRIGPPRHHSIQGSVAIIDQECFVLNTKREVDKQLILNELFFLEITFRCRYGISLIFKRFL